VKKMRILLHLAVGFLGFFISCAVTTIIIVRIRSKKKHESEET